MGNNEVRQCVLIRSWTKKTMEMNFYYFLWQIAVTWMIIREQREAFYLGCFTPFLGGSTLKAFSISNVRVVFKLGAKSAMIKVCCTWTLSNSFITWSMSRISSQLCEHGVKGTKLTVSPKSRVCKRTNYLLESMYLLSLQTSWNQIH